MADGERLARQALLLASIWLGTGAVGPGAPKAHAQEDRADTPDARPQGTLAIVGGLLIDGNGGPPVENAVVLVEGDRVARVGTVADTEVPAGARVLDAEGYAILPGLHDVHVHTMIVGHGVYSEYFPRYRDRMRELMPVSARELLTAGVTSARDVGGPLEESVWLREEIEAGRLEGPRMFVSGPFIQKTTSGWDDWFRETVDGPEDARRKVGRLIDAGVDFIKVTQLGQMTPEERAAIAAEARRAGLHLAVHAWHLEEHRMAAEMGAATIEHLGAGPQHRLQFGEESVRVLSASGVIVVPTAIVSRIYEQTQAFPERLDGQQLRNDLPADVYADVRRSLEHPGSLAYFAGKRQVSPHYGAMFRKLYDGGVRFLVGTDAGTPMNFHYDTTWREMELLVRYGVPPLEVISAATRDPARLYGMEDELGTIEVGKYADLIVVDGDPLRSMDVLRPRGIVHVIKGGVQYR